MAHYEYARCGCGTLVKLPNLKARAVACEDCHRARSERAQDETPLDSWMPQTPGSPFIDDDVGTRSSSSARVATREQVAEWCALGFVSPSYELLLGSGDVQPGLWLGANRQVDILGQTVGRYLPAPRGR